MEEEEEPEGEVIMGPCRKALRSSVNDTLLMQFSMILGKYVYYCNSIITFFPLPTGEALEKEDVKAEESKSPPPGSWPYI